MNVKQYIAKNSKECKELEDAVEILLNNFNIILNNSLGLSCEKKLDLIEVRPSSGSIDTVAILSEVKGNSAKITMCGLGDVYININNVNYRISYNSK